MPKIFISYRREDSQYAAHSIYKKLRDRFGVDAVVFDVDAIPLGVDFREYLTEQVDSCDVLLSIIGNRWLELLGARLADHDDFVRIEIQSALERGIPVVPVLVGNAEIPLPDDLPADLAELPGRQASEMRGGPGLDDALDRLSTRLDQLLDHAGRDDATSSQRTASRSTRSAVPDGSSRLVLGITLLFLLGGPAWLFWAWRERGGYYWVPGWTGFTLVALLIGLASISRHRIGMIYGFGFAAFGLAAVMAPDILFFWMEPDTLLAPQATLPLYAVAGLLLAYGAILLALREGLGPIIRGIGPTLRATWRPVGRAILLHFLGGRGLFFVARDKRRRWLYPLALGSAIVCVVMAWLIDPFQNPGETFMLIGFLTFWLYLAGFVDTIVTTYLHLRREEAVTAPTR